jgi:hypothetical protein
MLLINFQSYSMKFSARFDGGFVVVDGYNA